MAESPALCCICMKNSEVLSTLDNIDSNNVKHLKKLIFCVPNEAWKEHYSICNPCVCQLDIAYQFIQSCIESENFRKKVLEESAGDTKDILNDPCNFITKEEKFTCENCGKSFRQKKYLSQHITKVHINKNRRDRSKKVVKVKSEEDVAVVESKIQNDICNDVKSESVTIKDDLLEEEQNKENTQIDLSEGIEAKTEDPTIKSDPSDTEEFGDTTDVGNYDQDYDVHLDGTYSDASEVDADLDVKPKKQPDKKKGVKKEPQKCSFCVEVFKKRQDWAAHIRTQHTFEKPFNCDQCDARYMNRYSLLIHSRKHKNERPFICATCGKSFVSSADLNHHAKTHNQQRAYPCPTCDRSFKTHSNLRTHRLQMHLDPVDWKFPCNLCNKKFPIRGNLMKHLKRHAGIKEFDCHICDKKFVNKAELTLHLNTHTNQRLFKCALCGKDYKNREGLRRHMKVVHDQGNWKAPKAEKKYLCPMCPKIFAFGNKLQRHIFTHTGEKPFKCDYCQKSFIDNYARKLHYKKDHNVEYCGF